MRDEFHPPVEEYLQAIHSLGEEHQRVIQARIAERLGKSAASVSTMLDRLEHDGYVARDGRLVSLTPTGADVARRVVRRHRLAERLLADVIGLPWEKVHGEAGRWEHVISDDVEARLVIILGDPGTCPHGNPIPGSAHAPAGRGGQVPLAEVAPGTDVRFERMAEAVEVDPVSMRYLGEAGFVPGTTARVQTRAPDGTLLLEVGDAALALGQDLCRNLFVVAA